MPRFPVHVVALVVLFASAGVLSAQQETPQALLKQGRAVLAQTDGDLNLPGLKEPVEVLRDRWGVPHIYAKNTDDLFFAQGVVVAQDRLFQIDWWRRVGVGETAEVLGPKALAADRFARLVRYRGDMDAEWASYGPDAKRAAVAFTRGINAWIDHIGGRLPLEFQLLKYRPKKWQPEDCLARMSGIIMTRNMHNEITRARLIAAVGLEKAHALAPTDPPRPFAPAPGLDLAGLDGRVLADFYAASAPLRVAPPMSESNNWVVDGSRSASGKPMLASDPHRPTMVPSLRYVVHLNAPGWNVIGSGEPGLPGVALGHNDRIAWGITIIGTDQADLYVEQTKPGDPTQYRVGDAWEPMKMIKEQVPVLGGKNKTVVELRYTRHGPVVYQDEKSNRAVALRWVGSEPGAAGYFGALAVSKANNKEEFLEAVKGWKVPALNIVYADVDGHIGWIAAGLTPVRKGWDGLLPVPGHEGKYEWQGFLAVKDLPQRFDPPTHFLATANHNILPPGYPHLIGLEFSPPYRFRQVEARLQGDHKLTLAEFGDIQHDNTSRPAFALIRLLEKVDLPEKLWPAAKQLAVWNGRMTRESLAAPLYALWLQELQEEIYRHQVPPDLVDPVKKLSGLPTMLAALERADPAWFGKDAEKKRADLVRTTFARAVARLDLLSGGGRPVSWGQLHTVTFRHPLADLGPEYAAAFNRGPLARPGDANSPNNTSHDAVFRQIHGASYRQLFDLADWDRGLATSTPGQSGQPGSPHYDDLLPLWAAGEYFPLYYSRPRVEEATTQRLRLRPN
jgi:penicillin amidase